MVAYDISGMGDSPMHPDFEPSMRGRELLAVAEDAGFFDRDAKPFVVAHSQGGHSAMSAIEQAPDAFAGLVLCDMMMMRPSVASEYLKERRGLKGEVKRHEPEVRPHKVRPDLSSILERYKLAPPQICANEFLLEYVARHSIRAVEGGYIWKFDPEIRITDGHSLDWWVAQPPRFAALNIRRAIVHGEHSAVFTADSAKHLRELTQDSVPVIAIPDAHHHLMIDQPLAFASVVRALLESWRC